MRVSPELTKARNAYQNLQRFRKSSPVELDYKVELAEALEEKYAVFEECLQEEFIKIMQKTSIDYGMGTGVCFVGFLYRNRKRSEAESEMMA